MFMRSMLSNVLTINLGIVLNLQCHFTNTMFMKAFQQHLDTTWYDQLQAQISAVKWIFLSNRPHFELVNTLNTI